VIEVGTARPEELARVGTLVVETYVDGGFILADNPYVAQMQDAPARAQQAELVVARLSGAVVGTVTFCEPDTAWAEVSRPGEAEFRMLAVDASYQGQGVGRHLVEHCLRRTREIGAGATVISTVPRMAVARRMYERMGFVRSPQRDWSPRPGVDLLTYRREVVL
jgi:GNAT superfamily N-acetyltransferase